MLRIGVLVSGGGTNLQAIIDKIKDGTIRETEIAAVVSNKQKAYALERAKQNGIEACCISPKDYISRDDYDEALRDYFLWHQVELIVMAGFLLVLGSKFIDAFPNRIMNIHPSLIPAFCGEGYYGLKVHQAVLDYGAKITGATVHFVDRGTDTGPIILQKTIEVKDTDTAETLQQRVMREAEWDIYPKAIALYAQGKLRVDGRIVKIAREREAV